MALSNSDGNGVALPPRSFYGWNGSAWVPLLVGASGAVVNDFPIDDQGHVQTSLWDALTPDTPVLYDTMAVSAVWAQGLKPSFEVIGAVGGITPRITATMVMPGTSATQFSLGDLIGNSDTAASVVPIQFAVTRTGALGSNRSGRISGCRCAHSAASGTIVLPAFYLYIFRPETSIPFAAAGYPANNAAFNVSAAAMAELVGIFEFRVDDWLNQAGLATAAGTGLYQAVGLKPAAGSGRVRPFAPFNLAALGTDNLLGLMQAQNTWNPGAVANTFTFALDMEQN